MFIRNSVTKRLMGLSFACVSTQNQYFGNVVLANFSFIATKAICLDVALLLGVIKHFQLSNASNRSHPLSIQPIQSSINSYRYSFFVNSPFLWNSIPFAILRIKQSSPFCLSLRCYLFDF